MSAERYARRRRMGLCVRCGRTSCPGRALCPECAWKASERSRARRTELLERGVCPCCGRRRVVEERTLCAVCAMRRMTPSGRAGCSGRRRLPAVSHERRTRAMLALLEGREER